MYQIRLRQCLSALLFLFFWLTLLSMTTRLVMFYTFVDAAQLIGKGEDVLRMWGTGLRYDMRIAGMVVAPLLLLSLLFAIRERGWALFKALLIPLSALFSFIVACVSIGNYFYYQTYHNYIDVFAFGLFDDDTKAVLSNIWQDYPLLKSMMAAGLLSLPPVWYCYRSHRRRITPWPRGIFYSVLLLSLIMVAIGARGSVGTFPLRRGNAQVSELTVLNKLTPNGVMAIDWAIKDYRYDMRLHKVSKTEGDRLLTQVGLNALEEKSPVNPWLAQHKPHVVMNLMESFGSNLLALDEPQRNDLLGNLRMHFQQDFVFKRFVSQGNGTAPSLAALFFHSPMENISHSSAQTKPIAGTPFATYKQAGYRTLFISSGNMMWRNLVTYLPVQGVDKVYDQNSLMERYPESAAELTDWGVPDEYAYRLAEELLAEATQPLFIALLTITNHPPYVVPSHYVARPVALTDEVKRHAEGGQIEQVSLLQTYQYAANAFGNFLTNIKSSPLGERTVIAATGDHQMRRIKAYYPTEQVLDHAVPFYLYVPEPIRQQVALRFEPNRVGSHKDIFPTLYAFSLSGAAYHTLGGRNLLAERDDPSRAFGYNEEIWIDERGATPLVGGKSRYPWKQALYLEERAEPIETTTIQRVQAYPQLLRWQINASVMGMEAP
ncbi:LTA synthase family protein [Aeromonas simiae]|uniref:LTA synthase family protein n=1 Tax=Aeromonas simiae TaxID=218936 RepID=UPI0005AA616F|nr:LTA synthase family protein [Aeromonas simiae]